MSTRYFEVKLRRSSSRRHFTQRDTLWGLGLKKLGKVVFLKDTPAIRGMLYKVVHLIEVTPHEGTLPPSKRSRAREAR